MQLLSHCAPQSDTIQTKIVYAMESNKKVLQKIVCGPLLNRCTIGWNSENDDGNGRRQLNALFAMRKHTQTNSLLSISVQPLSPPPPNNWKTCTFSGFHFSLSAFSLPFLWRKISLLYGLARTICFRNRTKPRMHMLSMYDWKKQNKEWAEKNYSSSMPIQHFHIIMDSILLFNIRLYIFSGERFSLHIPFFYPARRSNNRRKKGCGALFLSLSLFRFLVYSLSGICLQLYWIELSTQWIECCNFCRFFFVHITCAWIHVFTCAHTIWMFAYEQREKSCKINWKFGSSNEVEKKYAKRGSNGEKWKSTFALSFLFRYQFDCSNFLCAVAIAIERHI